MSTDRREFLNLAASGAIAGALPVGVAKAAGAGKVKAIAFDGFTTFDPRPVFAKVEEIFPGKGAELSSAWRIRQFEYAWLRTLGGNYVNFWRVTEEALAFAAKQTKVDLSADRRDQIMQVYLTSKAWPDALPALKQLKDAGIRLAFLSNFTAAMLEAFVKNSGLEGLFEPHLTTDKVKAYKPDPRAYQMGVDAFKLKKEEIVFAAFGGWDAAGAKWFGYPTFWVNRANAPLEELGVSPDGVGSNLNDLVKFVGL